MEISETVRKGYGLRGLVIAGRGRSTLNAISLELKSLRVTYDISNNLKLCVGVERRMAGSRMRKVVPPPTMLHLVRMV